MYTHERTRTHTHTHMHTHARTHTHIHTHTHPTHTHTHTHMTLYDKGQLYKVLTSTSLTSSTFDSVFTPGSSLCLTMTERTLKAYIQRGQRVGHTSVRNLAATSRGQFTGYNYVTGPRKTTLMEQTNNVQYAQSRAILGFWFSFIRSNFNISSNLKKNFLSENFFV